MKHMLLALVALALLGGRMVLATTTVVENEDMECARRLLEMGDSFAGPRTAVNTAYDERMRFLDALAGITRATQIPLSLPFTFRDFVPVWKTAALYNLWFQTAPLTFDRANGMPAQPCITFGNDFMVDRGRTFDGTRCAHYDESSKVDFGAGLPDYEPNAALIFAVSTAVFENLMVDGGNAVLLESLPQNEDLFRDLRETAGRPPWVSIGGLEGLIGRVAAYALSWNITYRFYRAYRFEHPHIKSEYWEGVYHRVSEAPNDYNPEIIESIVRRFGLEEWMVSQLLQEIIDANLTDIFNTVPLPGTRLERKPQIRIVFPSGRLLEMFFVSIRGEYWLYKTISETSGPLESGYTVSRVRGFFRDEGTRLRTSPTSLSVTGSFFGKPAAALRIEDLRWDDNRNVSVGKVHYADFMPTISTGYVSSPLFPAPR